MIHPGLTIRKSTTEERRAGFPQIVAGNLKRIRVPKYVVVSLANDNIVSVFGLPQGGDTRAEAVFWAERCASKNGFDLELPDGWDKIEGKLPKED